MSPDEIGAPVDDGSFGESGCRHLPGANAATINVVGFLNSLPRLLLQANCGLQGFLLTIVKSHTGILPGTSKAGCTWPCPLPYPETFRPAASYKVQDAHLKRLINLQVLVLDWFHLGCPDVAPGSLRLGSKLSARQ